jgi:hypothetical protein
MQPVPIHAGPFIVAVLVKIIVGALWYSPLLFLKEWQRLAGVSDEAMKGGMAKGMITWIVGALLMTFVLAHAVYYAGAHSFGTGAAVGFFNWLGFILVVLLDDWAAAKRPFKLLAINAGANLVALVIMGAILGGWS